MHYTSDQLRDYQFGLLDEPQTAEIATHLETCADCRAALERIQQQFSALDLLNEQPEVSEEMIAKIVRATPASPFPRKIIPFRRAAAALAAAASIAIIFALLHTADVPPAEPSVYSVSSVVNSSQPSLAELRAEKPFAPASNIELNVLPRRDDVQLTIYNAEDLTLVREKRKLTLKRGWNWLQFMWSNTLIDPTSLALEPKTHADQIEITQLVYPPRLNELARWTIFSEFDGEAEFELTYFTSGLKWNAFYEATLSPDEQSIQLRSFVRIDNASGEDYENAETRLIVGEINLEDKIANLARQQYPYGDPRPRETVSFDQFGSSVNESGPQFIDHEAEQKKAEAEWNYKQKEILKQALSEYQLYTIEGRETIPFMWGKRLPSFDVQEIGVTNLYKYDEQRWGNSAMRFLSFANTETCKLGENPLPNGYVRVFGTGRDGSPSRPQDPNNPLPLSYIGATGIKYIPVGEEVELELGTAQKVMVEPKLIRTRTENYEFYTSDNQPDPNELDSIFGPPPGWYKGDISGWDEITDWKLEITNTRDLPVEIEITRSTDSIDWEINTDTPYEKYDAHHIRFTVMIEPRSRLQIEYELTVHHGSRKERN